MKTLAGKMIAVMNDVGHLGKDARNDFHRYEYTSDNQVYNAVRKAMITHGIAIFTKMPDVAQEVGTTAKGKPNVHTLARFEFELVCADSGESVVCPWFGEADDQNDKGVNKCATAALKYFLLKTFIIPTGDDPDADSEKPVLPVRRDRSADRRIPTAPRTPPTPAPDAQANGVAHDWSTDERTFTQDVCNELKRDMAQAGVAKNEPHAANIILQAMKQEHDADGWSAIYNEFTACGVAAAVKKNRNAKQESNA
jgi:hypothetical protein